MNILDVAAPTPMDLINSDAVITFILIALVVGVSVFVIIKLVNKKKKK